MGKRLLHIFAKYHIFPDPLTSSSTRNIFSSLGKEEHSMRQKHITAVYAKSFIQSSCHVDAIALELVQNRLLPVLWKSADSNTLVDVLLINFAYGLDFVAAFIFGLSRGTNFIQQEDG